MSQDPANFIFIQWRNLWKPGSITGSFSFLKGGVPVVHYGLFRMLSYGPHNEVRSVDDCTFHFYLESPLNNMPSISLELYVPAGSRDSIRFACSQDLELEISKGSPSTKVTWGKHLAGEKFYAL